MVLIAMDLVMRNKRRLNSRFSLHDVLWIKEEGYKYIIKTCDCERVFPSAIFSIEHVSPTRLKVG